MPSSLPGAPHALPSRGEGDFDPAPPISPIEAAGSSHPWSPRYDMLDGWRGLAALAVVVHHVAAIPIGDFAVMMFFVISGYCITASAESCLRRGMGFRAFMWRRVRRIFPPYLCSLAFFLATRAVKALLGGENQLVTWTPLEYAQNLTLIQWLTLAFHPLGAAPENPALFVAAYWSLCYEEQFYLIVAAMMALAAGRGFGVRWMILGLSAGALAWNIAFPTTATGVFIDYWAHFAVGSLLFYRLCRAQGVWARRLIDLALLVVAVGCIRLVWFSDIDWTRAGEPITPGTRIAYAELATTAVFALLLIALRPLNTRFSTSRIGAALKALGLISFSLYLVHQFNLNFVGAAAGLVLPARAPEWLAVAVQLAGHIAVASIFWYACERPFLNKSLIDAPPAGAPGRGAAQAGG